MSKGSREELVAAEEKARADHVKAIEKLGRTLKQKETKLLREKAKLDNPGNLKNLTVTWEQDGKEMKIGPLEEADLFSFFRAVDAIPRSVRHAVDRGFGDGTVGRQARLEQIRGELTRIPREYRHQRAELETKIYRCDERIAKLKEGATP